MRDPIWKIQGRYVERVNAVRLYPVALYLLSAPNQKLYQRGLEIAASRQALNVRGKVRQKVVIHS